MGCLWSLLHSSTIEFQRSTTSSLKVSRISSNFFLCFFSAANAIWSDFKSRGPIRHSAQAPGRLCRLVLTERNRFCPVHTSEKVIQCLMPCCPCHFPCHKSSEVRLCPIFLNPFAVSSSDTRLEVKRKVCLADVTVRSDMELRDKEYDLAGLRVNAKSILLLETDL